MNQLERILKVFFLFILSHIAVAQTLLIPWQLLVYDQSLIFHMDSRASELPERA